MKKWLILLVVVLFTNDILVDAFDASCAGPSKDQVCHSCVCGTHYVAPQTESRGVPMVTRRLVVSEQTNAHPPFARLLLNPPKVLA